MASTASRERTGIARVSDTESREQHAVVFDSSRRFQVWLYTVSHAQPLMRSVKAGGQSTRIDLLVNNVRALDLPTSTEGLAVRRDARSVHPFRPR